MHAAQGTRRTRRLCRSRCLRRCVRKYKMKGRRGLFRLCMLRRWSSRFSVRRYPTGAASRLNSNSHSLMAHDVRMRGFRERAEVSAVTALLDERLQRLATELVTLQQAAGRVLAEDVVAACAVPGFDRAAMDGYALRGSETFGAGSYNPLEFDIVGE